MDTHAIAKSVDTLIAKVTASAAERDHAVLLLGETLKTVIITHVPADQRDDAIKLINEEIYKINTGDLRVASGFFGNWAKHSMQNKK